MPQPNQPTTPPPRTLGRYVLFGEIAAGGMATLHLGRLLGDAGFARTVAIKRLRPALARDPQFVRMFLDEARVAARIRHPNVGATIDVVCRDEDVLLVLEYVHGESLGRLVRAERSLGRQVDPRIACAVICGALHGLHAAHEAKDERGEPLHIVHRDVSPQNVLVGSDGIARVVDFGIAKARGHLGQTQSGDLKGKIAYMAPEQLRKAAAGAHPDRRTDVFAAGIVLWEALTGQLLFDDTGGDIAILKRVQTLAIPPPGRVVGKIPPALDGAVLRALERSPGKRFPTARAFALAIEDAMPTGIASQRLVSEWVERVVGRKLAERAEYLLEIESALPSDVESQGLASLPPPIADPDTISTLKKRKPPPTVEDEATDQDPPMAGDHVQDEKTLELPRDRLISEVPANLGSADTREWSTMKVHRRDLPDLGDEPVDSASPRAPRSRAESVVFWQSAPRRAVLVRVALVAAICTLALMTWLVSTCR